MKLSSQVRPISYLKAHAAEIVRNLANDKNQWSYRTAKPSGHPGHRKLRANPANNGPLKILALGMRQVEEGKVLPAENVVKRLRERRSPGDAVQCFADQRCRSGSRRAV